MPVIPPSDDSPDSAPTHAVDPASQSDPTPYSADPQDATSRDFPWPPRERESLIDAWGRTWHGAALAPRRFFASMPHDGSLGAAVLYYLSIGIPVAGAQLFWVMVGVSVGAADAAEASAIDGWSPLIDFLASPLILLLTLFAAAGATHVLLIVLGARGGRFSVTARVFAFAYSPQILGVVPAIGSFVGFVWMVVIAIVGVREAHRTSTGRAAAAILIPLGIVIVVMVIAVLIAATSSLLDLPSL